MLSDTKPLGGVVGLGLSRQEEASASEHDKHNPCKGIQAGVALCETVENASRVLSTLFSGRKGKMKSAQDKPAA